jgi:hypothetical protein
MLGAIDTGCIRAAVLLLFGIKGTAVSVGVGGPWC